MANGKGYITSLWSWKDSKDLGPTPTDQPGIYNGSAPIFVGDVGVANGIVFADGTVQTTAGGGLPTNIDGGTF